MKFTQTKKKKKTLLRCVSLKLNMNYEKEKEKKEEEETLELKLDVMQERKTHKNTNPPILKITIKKKIIIIKILISDKFMIFLSRRDA